MEPRSQAVAAYLADVPEWRLSARGRQRLTRICRFAQSLPEVGLERFGERHLIFRVRAKAFGYYLNHHHDDGKIGLCVKSTAERQAELVESEPERFYVPAYLGASGWVGVRVDLRTIDWAVIERLLVAAFELAAPKRVLAEWMKRPDTAAMNRTTLEHTMGTRARGSTRSRSGSGKGKVAVAGAAPASRPAGSRREKSPTPNRRMSSKAAPVTLLSGGNPQISKAEGDAPLQAYIDAMPGWKREVGERLDAIIVRTVPPSAGLRKAVKWNSPFYGVEGKDGFQGWFLAFHCFAKYVKVTFFRGTSLDPMPPGESKTKETRYLDIREGEEIDESQVARWVKQASRLPGWGGT